MTETNEANDAFILGMKYFRLEDWGSAIKAFDAAISLKSDFAEAHYYLGRADAELGRNEEAIGAYKQAIRIKPDYAEAYYNLSYAYDRWENRKEVFEALKQAIRIEPDYASAHLALGEAYDGWDMYEEALESFKQAMDLKPDDASFHYDLGWYYRERMLGDLDYDPDFDFDREDTHYDPDVPEEAYVEEARRAQAIRRQPENAEAHYNLGKAFLTLRDRCSALAQYKILKDLDAALANRLFDLIYD